MLGALNGRAQRGGVILGRGGFFALKDRSSTLHVRIQADLAYRIQFLVEHKIAPNPEAARQAIERSDQDRAAFIRDIAGLEWGDPQNFDLVLDISREGLEGCVLQIVTAAKQRFTRS